MTKLKRYTKTSPIMNLTIEVNGEVFKFNLAIELAIKERTKNEDIKSQPQIYALLKRLQNQLIKDYKDKEREKDKTWATLFIYYQTSKTSKYFLEHQKSPTQKICECLVESNPKYLKICRTLTTIERNKNDISGAVEAFEQRASMLQTLSANERKEKF